MYRLRSSRIQSARQRIRRIGQWLDTPEVDVNTKSWLMAAAVLALLSALFREPILVLMATALAVVALAVRVWWDQCFRGLTYTRKFSTQRAFHGDEISLELEVINAKPLPITRLEAVDSVTANVTLLNRKLEASESPHTLQLRSLFSLGMYERVTYRYRIACHTRGWHRFGPVVLSASDPLGLVVRRETQRSIEGYLVYPRVVPITHLVVPARQPFGDFTPQQSLVEDPMRMAGVREYVPGDSPRRVHWRATARTGTMQTRINEPSASPVAAIFLDTITFSYLWEGQNSALLELAVTTAASLANQLLSGRHQVGLYANAPMPGRSRTVRVPPGRRPGQYTRILEDLAMLMPAFGERIERMVVEELPRLPWGSTIVIITCRVTEGMQRSLLRLARTSGTQRFVLIAIGAKPELVPELQRRLPVYHLSDEEAWDQIQYITLTRQG